MLTVVAAPLMVRAVRSPLPALVTVFMLAHAAAAYADPPQRPKAAGQAEQIVFLLQYVGNDYGAAVREGKIVDEAEYRENREFASLIAERFGELRSALPAAKAQALEDSVRSLVRLVEARADPREVKEMAESAIPTLIEAFGLHAFPRERPDPKRAAALFAENCAPCHGTHGEGDGPRAKELDPPPVRFSDANRLDAAAPYLFYNAITLGVANTAMASFAESLSDQERWDLAFFLWGFRVPPPSTTVPPVRLSLRDLATRSSTDLAPEVMRQAAGQGRTIDGGEAMRWIARLRADPPTLSDAQERLARMRQDLARSVALVEQGKLEAAADAVTTSYLTEFEPLEPEIDRHDRSVRQRFERGLIDFRAALRRKDQPEALRTARELAEIVDRADEILEARPTRRAWKWGAALALLAAAAVLAIVVRGRRIGNTQSVG